MLYGVVFLNYIRWSVLFTDIRGGDQIMIEAKCYYVTGLFRYYRTLDGKTFSVRDNEAYFYHGNVYKNQGILVYIKDAEKLKKNVKFVD